VPSGNPCLATQYQNFQGGNRDLSAEKSTTWQVGTVWNPLDDLSISLDWYNVELEDEIGLQSMQSLFDQEYALDSSAPSGGTVGEVTRAASGRVLGVSRLNSNIAKRKTDGLDVEANYGFSVGAIGDFRAGVQWTYVNEYERDAGDGNGLRAPPFFKVNNRGTGSLNWALGDFSANVIWNYVGSGKWNEFDWKLDDWSTWDLSVSYATPWNGLVTVGARNIFDEDPPTTTANGFPNPYYSNYLADVYGRIPYLRYEQDL